MQSLWVSSRRVQTEFKAPQTLDQVGWRGMVRQTCLDQYGDDAFEPTEDLALDRALKPVPRPFLSTTFHPQPQGAAYVQVAERATDDAGCTDTDRFQALDGVDVPSSPAMRPPVDAVAVSATVG